MHQQHQQRDLARAQRAAMEADELRECTFQPRTNQSALSAWRAYRQEHRAEHRREEARAESAEGRSPMRPLSAPVSTSCAVAGGVATSWSTTSPSSQRLRVIYIPWLTGIVPSP